MTKKAKKDAKKDKDPGQKPELDKQRLRDLNPEQEKAAKLQGGPAGSRIHTGC